MGETFRGGNSRLLAKQLDQLAWPVVVLDQRLEIVFASAALCEAVKLDATKLVGLRCSPDIPVDDDEHRGLTMLLAPPSEVLHGQASARQVPWPILNPTESSLQVFVPLIDDDPSQGLILVLFGPADNMLERFDLLANRRVQRSPQADELLIRLRSQWQNLDGLLPLLGTSPSITLAMKRAQLAISSSASVWVHGPAASGKSEVARAIFACRAKSLNLPATAVQLHTLDCSVADADLMLGLLDSVIARGRRSAPAQVNHVLIEHIDQCDNDLIAILDSRIDAITNAACVISTSTRPLYDWSSHSGSASRIGSRLSTFEIFMPPVAERREDIHVLIQQGLSAAANRAGRRLPAISPAALEALEAYSWPGNLREIQQAATEMLNNAVLTAAILPQHLPLAIRTFGGTLGHQRDTIVEPIKLDDVLLELERVLLERALRLSPRNRAKAARMLGISRPRLLRRISQLGLAPEEKSLRDEFEDEEE